MSKWGKVNGVELTDEMIDAIEANALAGFPGVEVVEYARHSPSPAMKDETLNVRIPAGYKRAIEAAAIADHVTQSAIVRDAIGAWLMERELVA
ncbi:MAG: hypothetical protein LBK28_00530 [Propionibacteriaceae bacterium]|jgi:hypothetical protein|nr:hypothetical protein [Propionibacteriaceae bacterium]